MFNMQLTKLTKGEFMNFMTPVVIVLMSLSAVAQLPPLDPQRQAERDARDRQNQNPYDNGQQQGGDRNGGQGRHNDGRGHGQGYGGPGYIIPGGPRPGPRPPMPPPPPPPQYGGDYGPGYTVRWQDLGQNTLPKLVNIDVVLDVRGQYVNEILFRAIDNEVQINQVTAYLSNGQAIDVRQATGRIRQGGEIRAQLDYRFSYRVDRIVVNGTSSNLFGGRGSLSSILGLAY